MAQAKKSAPRFPISLKIILLFVPLILLVIMALSAVDFVISKARLEKRVLADLTALAESESDQATILVEQDFESMNLLASRLGMRQWLWNLEQEVPETPYFKDQLNLSLKEAKNVIKPFRKIRIIDLKRQIVASTEADEVDKEISDTPFFRQGEKGPYLEDLYQEKGILMYSISVPLYHPQAGAAQVIGVLKADIDVSKLMYVLTEKTGLGDTGEVILGKRLQDNLLFITPLRHREGGALMSEIPLNADLGVPMRLATEKDRKPGIIIGPDYRGVKVLAAYKYVPIGDWGLVVKIDMEEAEGPIKDLLLRTVIIAAVTLTLSIVVIMLFVEFLSGPILRLHKGIDIISGGDLTSQVPVTTRDEIGDLAAAFNHMTERLRQITATRDELNLEIVERKKAEEILKRALETRSRFTAVVSHELRTPLAAIKESIDIVNDGLTGEVCGEGKEFLDIAKRNVDRLARLINDILDFQKLEADKMKLDMAENDINEVVLEACKMMIPLASAKGLDIIIEGDKAAPVIKFDRDKIFQVITNLIDNAVKFTEKGVITVTTTKEGNDVHVKVKDTGRGFRPEEASKLFESFEQLGDFKERKGGTGLGLAISKELIIRHKGRIWAESEYGKGAAFHFILPISAQAHDWAI